MISLFITLTYEIFINSIFSLNDFVLTNNTSNNFLFVCDVITFLYFQPYRQLRRVILVVSCIVGESLLRVEVKILLI